MWGSAMKKEVDVERLLLEELSKLGEVQEEMKIKIALVLRLVSVSVGLGIVSIFLLAIVLAMMLLK
jgi:hypothetical protein